MISTASFQHPNTGWPITVTYSFGKLRIEVADWYDAFCGDEDYPEITESNRHFVIRDTSKSYYAHGPYQVVSGHDDYHDAAQAYAAIKSGRDPRHNGYRYHVRDANDPSPKGDHIRHLRRVLASRAETVDLVRSWQGRRCSNFGDAERALMELAQGQCDGFDDGIPEAYWRD